MLIVDLEAGAESAQGGFGMARFSDRLRAPSKRKKDAILFEISTPAVRSVGGELIFGWALTSKAHAEPDALERLMPPWEHGRAIRRTGTIREVGSHVEIRVRIGPFWRTWISEHTACQEGRMFRDRQIKGPFAVWQHTHNFEPDGSSCFLEDRVEYALPMGALGRMFAGRLVRRKLDCLFSYRHESLPEQSARYARP